MLNLSLLSAVLLILGLGLNLGVSAALSLRAPELDMVALPQNDRNAWVSEFYPRKYYPTGRNFRIYKPGISASGDHYGGYYLPGMLRSRTLVDSVLDRRHLSYRINELGFRETG